MREQEIRQRDVLLAGTQELEQVDIIHATTRHKAIAPAQMAVVRLVEAAVDPVRHGVIRVLRATRRRILEQWIMRRTVLCRLLRFVMEKGDGMEWHLGEAYQVHRDGLVEHALSREAQQGLVRMKVPRTSGEHNKQEACAGQVAINIVLVR